MAPAYDERLAGLIRQQVKGCIGDSREVGLLFSGGVDSAVLAVTARKFADVTLYVGGTADSHDLKVGQEAGYMLDLPTVPVVFSKKKVLDSLEDLVLSQGLDKPKWATAITAFNMLIREMAEEKVLCGQGADELFGGYQKYSRVPGDEASRQMADDLIELAGEERKVYESISASRGKTLCLPFLEQDVVGFSKEVPFDCKILDGENKKVLRDAARLLGVPEAISSRPKKAIQYGTGVSKILKAHLKETGLSLPELMDSYQATSS